MGLAYHDFLMHESESPHKFCNRAKHSKTVLIMDEVDGMSAGDRGGVADLIASIKISKIPIICICNDRYSQKLRSLVNYCLLLSFRKPTKQQVLFHLLFSHKYFGFPCLYIFYSGCVLLILFLPVLFLAHEYHLKIKV